MPKLPRKLLSAMGVAALVVGFVFIIGDIVKSQPPESKDAAAAATPPAGQTYVGVKRARLATSNNTCPGRRPSTPRKRGRPYRPSTGRRPNLDLPHDRLRRGHRFQGRGILGEPVGTTCERATDRAASTRKPASRSSTEDVVAHELKIAHGTIYKVQPRNVCIACHPVQGHKRTE